MRAKDSKKSTISLLIIIAVVIAAMFIINVICKYNFLTVNNWMLIIAGRLFLLLQHGDYVFCLLPM